MTSARIAQARRRVDELHQIAVGAADPAVFMRKAQAQAEADYARRGGSIDLALCRALAESLDGEKIS